MLVPLRRCSFSLREPAYGSVRAFNLQNCHLCVVFATPRSRRVKFPSHNVLLGIPPVFGLIRRFQAIFQNVAFLSSLHTARPRGLKNGMILLFSWAARRYSPLKGAFFTFAFGAAELGAWPNGKVWPSKTSLWMGRPCKKPVVTSMTFGVNPFNSHRDSSNRIVP